MSATGAPAATVCPPAARSSVMSPSNGARERHLAARPDGQPADRVQALACGVGGRGGHCAIGLRLFDRSRAGGSFLQQLLEPLRALRRLRQPRLRFLQRALGFRADVALRLLQRHELEDHVAAARPARSSPRGRRSGARDRRGDGTDLPGGTIVSPPTVRVSDTGSIATFIVWIARCFSRFRRQRDGREIASRVSGCRPSRPAPAWPAPATDPDDDAAACRRPSEQNDEHATTVADRHVPHVASSRSARFGRPPARAGRWRD